MRIFEIIQLKYKCTVPSVFQIIMLCVLKYNAVFNFPTEMIQKSFYPVEYVNMTID